VAAEPERANRHGPLSIILLITCIFVMFIAVFEMIALLVNHPNILDFLSGKSFGFFLLLPFPEVVFRLDGTMLQLYWLFVVAALIACVIHTLRKFARAARSGGISRPDAVENTAGMWIGIFLSAMLFINFVVSFVLISAGVEMTAPDFGDKTEMMFLLADAAFWEEIVSRLLIIGLPMAVISLIVTRKKESLKCLFGGFGMSMTAVVLIVISGAIFGMAHYGGWDNQAWKVLTAGIMGAFLGYVFVRFGLYASILLHFITNYLSSFEWMGFGGIDVIITLLLMSLGFAALIYMVIRTSEYGRNKELPNFRNSYVRNS
jgi:heme/copper-type cytochrome/quinol oxidase subunit 3